MHNAIWKFPVRPGRNEVEMPSDSLILDAGCQNIGFEQAVIWAKVDTTSTTVKRVIYALPTGSVAPPAWASHVRSIQFPGSREVAHIFDAGILDPAECAS